METKKTIPEENWKTFTTERFVGFIDIMGFKDMVLKSTKKEIYDMFIKMGNYEERIKQIKMKDLIIKDFISIMVFSDSIMIYSKSNCDDSLKTFIATLASLTHGFLAESIPFKGAVAYGQMTIDRKRSIFFGQPLIDAYLLQEELNFYGIVIHGSAQKRIGDSSETLVSVTEYTCPFKEGFSKHLTIYPFSMSTINYYEVDKNLISAIKEMRYNTSGHIRKYIDLTEKYLNESHHSVTSKLLGYPETIST